MPNKEVRISFDKSNIFRETDMAYGIRIDDKNVFYLPKSQIDDWQEKDNTIYCYIPMWLVDKNGLDFLIDTSNEPTLF